MNHCVTTITNATTNYALGGHKVWEVVLIGFITGPLSLVTIIGNLLVVISFRVNRQLRTVSNYFLLSLAVADLILGAISMNLYAANIIMGRWALGSLACDIWLALDYVASNASVMNLLLISFDRFYSVTRPLTYRAKRTPRRAAVAIGLAWAVSFILWGPAILFWPHVAGRSTWDDCSIPFLNDAALTFGTAIAAFYLPVTIMVILYWKIYWEIEKRSQGLEGLLGSMSNGGVFHGPGGRSVYSSSAKSSISSFREVPCGRDQRGSESPSRLSKAQEDMSGRVKQTPSLAMSPRGGSYMERCRARSRKDGEEGAIVSPSSAETEAEPAQQDVRAGPTASTVPLGDTTQDTEAERIDGTQASGAEQEAAWVPKSRNSSVRGSMSSELRRHKQPKGRRRRNTIIREKKAARTLSAILLAFIITWTPYNIMVLASISYCVPEKLWHLGYWLCYINSTVNPVCYALCNQSFRDTFKTLLLCRLDRKTWGRRHNSMQASLRIHKTGVRTVSV
ncbi:muscarinic acetylcholine receptor M1 [Aplochiton taeniatus]